MLRISKLADYATVIMSYLALHPEQINSATEIAKAIHLSSPTVSKILKILSSSGLIKAFRGAGGGYQLARTIDSISVADIISAIEGNLALTECSISARTCELNSLCAIKHNWKAINKIIFKTLSRVTLKDMLRGTMNVE